MGIRSFTETTANFGAATAALQVEEGKIYTFKVDGSTINIDTTVEGLRAATGGTLAGAIADVAAAIGAAIDAKSGAGAATVDTSLSNTGTSITFDMTDSSGNPIVVSEVQTLTRAAQATGSLVINQDVTNSNLVVVSHGEYLTDDGCRPARRSRLPPATRRLCHFRTTASSTGSPSMPTGMATLVRTKRSPLMR